MRTRLIPVLLASGLAATATTAHANGSAPAADEAPIVLENCGETVVLEQPPQRVVLLGSDSVSLLLTVGALDRVVAKSGAIPTEYYDDETRAALDAIPTLTSGTGPTGGVEISQEAIIAEQPDLVIGYETETVTRAGLARAGIPLYVIPAFCPDGTGAGGEAITFDAVYDEVARYGEIFDEPQAASRAGAELAARVDAVAEAFADVPPRTGAALYVPAEGSTIYAYGPASMVSAEFTLLGIDNVFGDASERVFEISIEELLDRNPDVLVLLHDDSDSVEVIERVRAIPGASALTAITDDQVHPELFAYTDPPTPLSVTGLERFAERLATE